MPHFEFSLETKTDRTLFGQGWAPDGEPKAVLCLIHGLGEHSGRHSGTAATLNRAGYALLCIDLPGHGRSTGRRGEAAGYAELRECVSRLLKNAGERFPSLPVFLYGHSFGGGLALDYILKRHPSIAGAVITSPLLRPSAPPPAFKLGLVRALSHFLPRFTVSNGVDPADLSRDAGVVRAYRDDPLVHDRVTTRLAVQMLATGLGSMERASHLEIPVLLMHGSADRITSPAASAEFARQAGEYCTLRIWDGLFHELHNEPEREEVFEYLVDWLDMKVAETSMNPS